MTIHLTATSGDKSLLILYINEKTLQ